MKTKRILATVLAIAMLASIISVPVFAEEAVPTLLTTAAGDGYICEDLGILIGPDAEGVTEAYLDTLAMRTQAAMVNLRLVGSEAAALAFDGEATFADASDATEYWQPVLEYLKANPGMGWVGDENGNFLPNDYITGQAFTKILLVALGYEYGLYFDWETTMDFAAEIGMASLADKADDDLTIRDIANAIVEALGMKFNSDTNVTLLTQLVLDGVIDEETAVAAGFEVEEPSLIIINAYPSAVNEVTVLMSMDVPSDTPVTLKKGSAGYVVTETVDGSTLTLTTLFNLPAGTYEVTVGEETAEFEVMAPYATDLVVAADEVFLDDGQDLEVALLNQYGDEMSLTATNYSVFNKTDGYVYSPTVTDTIVIDVLDDTTGDGVEAGHEITVFVYDPASMLTVSKVVVVKDAPVLTEIVIGDVTLGDEDAAMLFEYTAGNVLDLEGIDQYGNAYEITFTDLMDGTIQYLLSNEDCIDIFSVDVVDGDIVFSTSEPGDFIFTFILPSASFVSSTEVLTVYADPEVVSIEISGPAEAVYAYETIEMPVAGIDQYGDVIDVTLFENTMFTTTVDLESRIGINSTNTVDFTANIDGTTTVYYFLNGILQGTFDVTVNEEAYPFQVVGIHDVPTAYMTNSYKVFSSTSIDVIDQYGRTVDMEQISDSGFELVLIGSPDNDNLRYEHIDLNRFVLYAEGEDELGTDMFYIAIYNPILNEVTDVSTFTFDASHVGGDAIAYFNLDVIDDVLYAGEMDWDYYGQVFIYNNYVTRDFFDYYLYPYDNPFLLKAYQEDGIEIALEYDGILPAMVDVITFSAENSFYFDYDTRTDYPETPTVYGSILESANIVMKVWIDGEMVASDEFKASVDDFAVASIEAPDETLDMDAFFDAVNDIPFWPEVYFDDESDFINGMINVLGDSAMIPWEFRYEAMNLFTINDQYDVELLYYPLLEDEMIQLIATYVEDGDTTTFYFTLMTVDGMIHDTLTVTGSNIR